MVSSYQDHEKLVFVVRPPDTTHWNVLGDSYQRVGELEKAREAYERSLRLDPNQEKVKTEIASLDTLRLKR